MIVDTKQLFYAAACQFTAVSVTLRLPRGLNYMNCCPEPTMRDGDCPLRSLCRHMASMRIPHQTRASNWALSLTLLQPGITPLLLHLHNNCYAAVRSTKQSLALNAPPLTKVLGSRTGSRASVLLCDIYTPIEPLLQCGMGLVFVYQDASCPPLGLADCHINHNERGVAGRGSSPLTRHAEESRTN